VSIIITIIIIMLMFFLIHVITWEGSQGPQEKSSVILEQPEWSVLDSQIPLKLVLALMMDMM
jgi:hypothetical protein